MASKAADTQSREPEHRRRLEEEEARSRHELSDSEQRERVWNGVVGYTQGLLPGVARGAYHTAQDTVEGLGFFGRLYNPVLDRIVSPPGETARDQALRGIIQSNAYLIDRTFHPSKALTDLNVQRRRANEALNPFTGYASTNEEQWRQANRVGKNTGETALTLATAAEGRLQMKLLKELGYMGKTPNVATYLERGAPPRLARYMAEPYVPGAGSHFIPQKIKWIPKWYMDSPFNRTLPAKGATKGQMAEFHHKNDDQYGGGNVSRRHGGGGWSAQRDFGWTRPNLPARLWRGAPAPLKGLGYAALAGLGLGVE